MASRAKYTSLTDHSQSETSELADLALSFLPSLVPTSSSSPGKNTCFPSSSSTYDVPTDLDDLFSDFEPERHVTAQETQQLLPEILFDNSTSLELTVPLIETLFFVEPDGRVIKPWIASIGDRIACVTPEAANDDSPAATAPKGSPQEESCDDPAFLEAIKPIDTQVHHPECHDSSPLSDRQSPEDSDLSHCIEDTIVSLLPEPSPGIGCSPLGATRMVPDDQFPTGYIEPETFCEENQLVISDANNVTCDAVLPYSVHDASPPTGISSIGDLVNTAKAAETSVPPISKKSKKKVANLAAPLLQTSKNKKQKKKLAASLPHTPESKKNLAAPLPKTSESKKKTKHLASPVPKTSESKKKKKKKEKK